MPHKRMTDEDYWRIAEGHQAAYRRKLTGCLIGTVAALALAGCVIAGLLAHIAGLV